MKTTVFFVLFFIFYFKRCKTKKHKEGPNQGHQMNALLKAQGRHEEGGRGPFGQKCGLIRLGWELDWGLHWGSDWGQELG